MDWTANRMLAKTNYRIHTDSIKQNIVPKITENQKIYLCRRSRCIKCCFAWNDC